MEYPADLGTISSFVLTVISDLYPLTVTSKDYFFNIEATDACLETKLNSIQLT